MEFFQRVVKEQDPGKIHSDSSTFHMTDASWHTSQHRFHNIAGKTTEIFINFQVIESSLSLFHLKNQWVLHNPVTARYYTYESSQVNYIHEWNPSKIGWMKVNGNETIVLPPMETLARQFELKHDHNSGHTKAIFHGIQNLTNMERNGKSFFCF